MNQIKWISLLLAFVLLAGCTPREAKTNHAQNISAASSSAHADASSAPADRAEAESNQTESANVVSATVSQNVATGAETSARQKAFRKIKKAIKKDKHASGYTLRDRAFELTAIPNDPCVSEMDTFDRANTFDNFEKGYDPPFEREDVAPLPQKEQKRVFDAARRRLLEIHAMQNPVQADLDPSKNWMPCYYYGKADDYDVVYIDWRPQGSVGRTNVYNRIAGYQFLCSELSQRHTMYSYDKHYNLDKDNSIKDALSYSGIFLVKNNKAATLEDLYLDGEIDANLIGKVHDALPKFLQCGKFEHYTEAFGLVGKRILPQRDGSERDAGAYYMTYHDRDGKFHVVVA